MTFAWYGHLRYKENAIWKLVLISWGIAFFEYCFMIPANHFGHSRFSGFELKMIQEVITLLVFTFFSIYFLNEGLRWNHFVGILFLFAAIGMVFYKW